MKEPHVLLRCLDGISNEIGILHHITRLPKMNLDPKMDAFGIWSSNTRFLNGERFSGRSSGCGFDWEEAVLGTIGETLERYAPVFYKRDDGVVSSFKNLRSFAIHPKEYALFHKNQHDYEKFNFAEFDENIELTWFETYDLATGKNVLVPGQFIYMPFSWDKDYITQNTSTGLASHTNYYKAILTALYELIERDSFVITWMQNIVSEKIILSREIESYINRHFPLKYDWHFFDISYDIKVPTVFGICFGKAEYGDFVAVGSSTRGTYGDAVQKVIKEIGQAIPYFRYLLGNKKEWIPTNNFEEIKNFEDHSIFYTKRKDLWNVFDEWVNQKETKSIELHQENKRKDKEEIRHVTSLLKELGYNVLLKDITTPDIRQLGFFSVKLVVPQLIPLAGSYQSYFLGGERLYSVPEKMGYPVKTFKELNKFPHPFP